MSKIKEINIKTTDGSWWRLIVDISAINDEVIANRILAETSVPARICFETREIDCLGNQMCINTANIVAIEVVREKR